MSRLLLLLLLFIVMHKSKTNQGQLDIHVSVHHDIIYENDE
jgi:hypothetical protein